SMTRTGREWLGSDWGMAAALAGAVLGLWGATPAAAPDDKPTSPPPTIFQPTKPQGPSAPKGMADPGRQGSLTPPPPPVQEWVLQPDGSMKNTRTGITVALRNVCAPGDMEHEAALAAFKRSQARKSH